MNTSAKKNQTFYQIILDASGSMESCRKQTIESLNEQIVMVKGLAKKNPDEEYFMGLVDFSDPQDLRTLWNMQRVEELSEVKLEDYVPRASTALWDAIGSTCMNLQDRVQDRMKQEDVSVVVMILSDGHENSSQLFTARNIQMLMKSLEKLGDWNFRFIGADFDIHSITDQLGVERKYAYSMSKANMSASVGFMEEEMDEIMAKKMNKVHSRK